MELTPPGEAPPVKGGDAAAKVLLSAHPDSPGWHNEGHVGKAAVNASAEAGANCGWHLQGTVKAEGPLKHIVIFVRDGVAKDTLATKESAKAEISGGTSQPACEEVNPKGECDNAATAEVEQCGTTSDAPSGGPTEEGEHGYSPPPTNWPTVGVYCAEWTIYTVRVGDNPPKFHSFVCHEYRSFEMSTIRSVDGERDFGPRGSLGPLMTKPTKPLKRALISVTSAAPREGVAATVEMRSDRGELDIQLHRSQLTPELAASALSVARYIQSRSALKVTVVIRSRQALAPVPARDAAQAANLVARLASLGEADWIAVQP